MESVLKLDQFYNPGEKALAFLKILNGNLALTSQELKLASVILDAYAEHIKGGLQEPYLSKFVFSTDGRKLMMDSMDTNGKFSQQNLTNLFKKLEEKGVLGKVDNEYTINPSLIVKDVVTLTLKERRP